MMVGYGKRSWRVGGIWSDSPRRMYGSVGTPSERRRRTISAGSAVTGTKPVKAKNFSQTRPPRSNLDKVFLQLNVTISIIQCSQFFLSSRDPDTSSADPLKSMKKIMMKNKAVREK